MVRLNTLHVWLPRKTIHIVKKDAFLIRKWKDAQFTCTKQFKLFQYLHYKNEVTLL